MLGLGLTLAVGHVAAAASRPGLTRPWCGHLARPLIGGCLSLGERHAGQRNSSSKTGARPESGCAAAREGSFLVRSRSEPAHDATGGGDDPPTVVGDTELKLRLGSRDLSSEHRDSGAWAKGDTGPFAIERRIVGPRTAHARCRLGRRASAECARDDAPAGQAGQYI